MRHYLVSIFLCFLFSVFIITISMCQEKKAPKTYYLNTRGCVKLLFKENYDILEGKILLENSKRNLYYQNKKYIPRFYIKAFNAYTLEASTDGLGEMGAGLEMKQPVYDASIGYSQEKALLNYEKSRLNYIRYRDSLIFKVCTLFINFLKNDKLLNISRLNLELKDRIYITIQGAYGVSTDLTEKEKHYIDLQKAELEARKAYNSLKSAETTRENSMIALAEFILMDAEAEIIPHENLKKALEEKELSLEQAINRALEKRQDLKSAEISIELAEIELAEIEAELYPTFNITGNINYASETSIRPSDLYNVSIESVWKLPLYDGEERDTRMENKRDQIEIKELEYRQLEETIRADIKSLYKDIESLQSQIDFQEKIVDGEFLSLEGTRIQYMKGETTIVDYLTSAKNLTDARIRKLQFEVDLFLKKREILFQMGTLAESIYFNIKEVGIDKVERRRPEQYRNTSLLIK